MACPRIPSTDGTSASSPLHCPHLILSHIRSKVSCGLSHYSHHTVKILPNHHMTSELYFMGSRGQGQQASCGMVSALLESSVEFQQLLLKMRIPNKDLSVSSLLLRPSLSRYPSDFFVFYRPWAHKVLLRKIQRNLNPFTWLQL